MKLAVAGRVDRQAQAGRQPTQARNAPGRVMRSGASDTRLAQVGGAGRGELAGAQCVKSMSERLGASQTWPGCTRERRSTIVETLRGDFVTAERR